MYNYEIPITESAYKSREIYLADKKRIDDAQSIKREYTEFVKNSRDYFLSEAINSILQNSLNEETSEEDRAYGKALVEGFVRESDTVKLLNEFSRKSLFLANISEAVNDAHKQVIHSSNVEKSSTFKISKSVNDEFFDKLIGLSDDKITEKINERVCDSISDFVQSNVNDKLDLEELAEKTKEKIDNIKARNSEERDNIVKEFTMQYNREVQRIKQRNGRKISLYEQILHSTTQSIVSDKTILESFSLESGQLDMGKIKGKVNVMYTFLEMLNTTKMVNVNESYIENILKSI